MAYLLKYYTFSAKIRTLSEFQVRLQTNQQPPSNAEIITTLRYFQQTLIGFLKDFPSGQAHFCQKFSMDPARWALYPNLNYSGLFYAIVNLLDVFPLITSGQQAVGEAILDTMKALMLFLDRDSIEQLPLALASQIGVFPSELNKQIVHVLGDCLFPFALCNETSIRLSVPGCIMLVLQNTNDPSLHTWILEAMMSCSEEVYRDVIAVIAKGTSESRVSAANLLFHYWPFSNPHVLHRKTIQYRVQAWTTLNCQNSKCTEKGAALKKCFDPIVCANVGDTSPPVFLCRKCADTVFSEKQVPLEIMVQPLPTSTHGSCQNKGCESTFRLAIGTCFSVECSKNNGYVPIRMCQECLVNEHQGENASHFRQKGSGVVWSDAELCWDMVEAIVQLLRETATHLEGSEGEGKRPKWLRQLEGGHQMGKDIDRMADERRMLSRFGVWLMAALTPPTIEANPKAISYMMSTVFQWFATTALLPNDTMGQSLEQLKTDFVCEWINLAIKNHYGVFIQTLSPAPSDSDDRPALEQTKEALGRLLALMPYDIISFDTWNRVIPKWLQYIYEEAQEEHLSELKVLLAKIFEPDLCPLPFDTVKVFEFLTKQLLSKNYDMIFHGLQWLHQLSQMEITIPLTMLLEDFSGCLLQLNAVDLPPIGENDLESDEVSLHVVMVDILVLQLRLNEISTHDLADISEKLFNTLALLLNCPIHVGPHCCSNPEMDEFPDCNACQQAAFLHQMLMLLAEAVSPKKEMAIQATEDMILDVPDEISMTTSQPSTLLSPQTQQTGTQAPGSGVNTGAQVSPLEGLEGLQFHSGAVVELNDDECVGILPSEEVEMEMAEAVTLTESDVGREGCHVITTTLIEGKGGTPSSSSQLPQSTPPAFWDTSVGRFRFTLDQLPAQLKLVHSLLQNLLQEKDPDVQCFMLNSLKYLCLHCEALTNARREHRGFLIWTLEHMFVPQMWTLLRSDFVQVGELASLLLIHCVTFPAGEDILWKVVTKDFTSERWETRFNAVGRAYVLAHMMKPAPVKGNKVVQTTLSVIFYHMVVSIHDPSAQVAQRALIALRVLPSTTLKLVCLCFEAQFDACIIDRPLLIHAIHTLTTQVPDETTLTFDFFIQRFETLVIESQLNSQSEETTFVQDLSHSDPMSELYQRKVAKARKALEEASTARSLVRHLKNSSLRHQLPPKIADEPADTSLQANSVASPAAYSSGGFGRLREFTDEESNMCLLLNRVVDMENPERHTVYLIISLFVAFLCNKKASPTDEKQNAKKQSLLFRHFNALLGYSNTEKCFTIPPARIRRSAVCNAFLSGLPEILDSNLIIGNQLLPTVVQLLIHLPSPQKLASDRHNCNYSLKLLTQHARHLWLNSLILILYKYRFDTVPVSDGVLKLINIVLKTLEGQAHVCPEEQCLEADSCAGWGDVSTDDDDGGVRDEEGMGTGPSRPSIVLQARRPETLRVARIAEQVEPIMEMETATVVEPTVVVMEPGGAAQASLVQSWAIQPTIVEPTSSFNRSSVERRKKKQLKKEQANEKQKKMQQSVEMRCGFCNSVAESFDEETLSLSLVSLSAFLHREPAMAAPILFRVLHTVTRLIDKPLYPWHSTDVFVPGNCRSVAKQMIRVVVHQLSSSGIAFQLFDSPLSKDDSFWSTIALSLADFTELSPVYFIQLLLEDIQESWPTRLSAVIRNLANYIVEIPTDSYIVQWSTLATHLDNFFRKYHTVISAEGSKKPQKNELESAIVVITHVMKVQNFSSFKSAVSLVDGFAKWLSESMHSTPLSLPSLLTVCTACNRALIRERDKQCITRAVVSELIHAIKFKCPMNEANYMTIANMILQDAGESIPVPLNDDQFNTAAAEAVRPFLFEIIDFISDLHVLAKIKKEIQSDSVGGDLKVALAEVIAVEMSRSNSRDCRTVIRFIPWLMSPPSVTQAAPGAFADSVSNVRVLSWLLLGALHAGQHCLPVPIECSQHMADYIHFVLAGFADQSKQSVVHMSALFHAFHLCQLWTVYCEKAATYSSQTAFNHLLDFWARVTPAILQLLSHSKVLADMVNLHFLNTIQALQQVNSALLCQLFAMWAPILTAYHSQIPSQLRMKLDSCENQPALSPPKLAEWLKKVRYKIAQVELQTSAASPYYTV
ncbi:unnamed protein product, partial [Mesorhabditis belari]|uniref:Uncoordinated protein 79 n=1 Tax=Mesorhabditis belari TaxID=2138241 RepID=A0AAF3E9F1_9BILA